jgi:hypothetical protein
VTQSPKEPVIDTTFGKTYGIIIPKLPRVFLRRLEAASGRTIHFIHSCMDTTCIRFNDTHGDHLLIIHHYIDSEQEIMSRILSYNLESPHTNVRQSEIMKLWTTHQYALVQLGYITELERQEVRKREAEYANENNKERRRQQYEELKKEFENLDSNFPSPPV